MHAVNNCKLFFIGVVTKDVNWRQRLTQTWTPSIKDDDAFHKDRIQLDLFLFT